MIKLEKEFGQGIISLETDHLAKQANGSVLVQCGNTVVLVASTAAKKPKPGQDFFPLAVFYVEKRYAAGQIPGGFFKREGRLSDRETLFSRLIDRPLRPMFDKNFNAETVVQATVLSYDRDHAPEVAALIGASASLYISDIPFYNPIAGMRVGKIGKDFIANPTAKQLEKSELNIIMAGSDEAVLMVEGEALEVDESAIVDAIMYGQEQIQGIIQLQKDLRDQFGKEKLAVEAPFVNEELQIKATDMVSEKIASALKIKEKQERYESLDTIQEEAIEALSTEDNALEDQGQIKAAFAKVKKEKMRAMILDDKIRIDGRKTDEIRKITCETGLLPKTHGSAVFTRGETQALVVTTLGTKDGEQMIDGLDGVSFKNFMLHYNFPAFSVGEARMPRGPGRREVGHGYLAERGLEAVLPAKEDFGYTIRLVSEILESNGSSSMATVCGGSLAMMDAGVPISKAVSGIAMGLIYTDDKQEILSDILGDEDHLGDMDFKVVGTKTGITSLQMDIKVTGINKDIITRAMLQAKAGRHHILDEMNKALDTSRTKLSGNAPRFLTLEIDKSKIRDVIGPGGKVIKSIVETTGAKLDIDDSGIVRISSIDSQSAEKALEMVKEITKTAEIGVVYQGKVTRIEDYGTFVEILPGCDGLVHISNMSKERVKSVRDIVKMGQVIEVLVTGFDKRGKVQLSMKELEERKAKDTASVKKTKPAETADATDSTEKIEEA